MRPGKQVPRSEERQRAARLLRRSYFHANQEIFCCINGRVSNLHCRHTFLSNGKDGYSPLAGLVFDAAGNLYGTTSGGGPNNFGTVFELTPSAGGGWTETLLYSWGDNTSDNEPQAGLILDSAGNLYGTTPGDSSGYGAVFEVTP